MAHIISEECTTCGLCFNECPVEAIEEGKIYYIDPDTCIDCGVCSEVCPVDAITEE